MVFLESVPPSFIGSWHGQFEVDPAEIWDHVMNHAARMNEWATGDHGDRLGEDRLPSGEHTKNYGKIHHFSWENPLFLWPFSIAMLVEGTGKVKMKP